MALSDEEDSKPDFYHEGAELEHSGVNGPGSGGAAGVAAAAAAGAEIDDEDIGEVNMDELGSKVWLVKVPTFLAEKWKQPREEGAHLGKMRIYDKPDKNGSTISIILGDSDEYRDIPKEYRMQVTNEKVRNMLIFSEERDPTKIVKPTSVQANKAVPIAMTGTVHHECTVTPHYTTEYKRIVRKRFLDRHMNARRTQTLHSTELNRSMLTADASVFDTAQKKPKIDTRMARMERQDLINTLFACFEKHPYWSLKGLIEYTRQPVAYLKEVLGDIAVLNKSGGYNNTYALKPEFNKAAAAAAAASAAAAPPAHAASGTGDDDDDLDNIDEEDDFEDV
ncbi:hypothetical protein H4R18_000204 [Coemansia javaensis]|uniref:Transcription initiation factor IIF subunit beta n=1 Tax=Coemansia javaensis TaxID=2761396 RepID=A0A9W8HLX9_9FUNG|nr:hypothetical protein H4R18_000204 [Coemansia javaensis]